LSRQQKGLVAKQRDERNQSRIRLKVAAKSEVANAQHPEYHGRFKRMVEDVLSDAPADKVTFAKVF